LLLSEQSVQGNSHVLIPTGKGTGRRVKHQKSEKRITEK
jgi:hypothetical protein